MPGFSVMWCGASLKCDGLLCAVTFSVVVLWWTNLLIQFYQVVVF